MWSTVANSLSRWFPRVALTLGRSVGNYSRAKTLGAAGAPPGIEQLPSRKGGQFDNGERVEEHVHPVKSWSFSSIRQAALLADDGDMRWIAHLCETLMGDERIASKLEDRALALTSAPITFEQAPKGRAKKAAMRAAQAEEDWFDMVPEQSLAEMLKWYRMMGIALGELVWVDLDLSIPIEQDGNGNWHVPNVKGKPRIRNGRNVPRLKVWHPQHLRWDWRLRCFFLRLEGGYEERIVPGQGKWVLWANGSRPWAKGLWRGLSIVWLMKALAGPTWGRQGERHANGTAIMSGPEAYDAELRRELTEEWRRFGDSGIVWVPAGSKLEIFELAANTWATYKAQIDTANTAIDIAIMGANLPTEVSSGAGTGATAQMQTVQLRTAGDAAEWETLEHSDIGKPWALANFGNASVAPWAIRNVKPSADLSQLANTQKAASEAYRTFRGEGAPIDEVAFLQSFKIAIDESRVGARGKPTLFAWHITSSMLTFGEARVRYDETLPSSPFDKLRYSDVFTAGGTPLNEQAVGVFNGLIAEVKKQESKEDNGTNQVEG
jgi:hypothetical protein